MDKDVSPILATLRRRAFLALAVRHVLLLMVAAAVMGLGVKGVAIAILMALALAVVRCPDLHAVAKQTDRTLRLEERVRTAFEWREGRDDVSRLLQQDAAQAIESIRPGDVYPLRLFPVGRTMTWAALVAAALVAAQIWTTYVGRTLVLPLKWSPNGGGAVPHVASTQALEDNEAGAEPTADVRTDDVAARGDAPSSPEPSVESTSSERSSVTEGASPGNEPAPVSQPGTSGQDAFDLDDGTRFESLPRPQEALAEGASSSERETGAPRLASSADPRRVASGPAQTGGYAEERPSGASEPTKVNPKDWDAIEAAMSRNEVPPGLRNYVRDYFAAIRQRK